MNTMTAFRFGGRWLKGTTVVDLPQSNPGSGHTIPAQEIMGFAYGPAIVHTTSPPDTIPRFYMFFCMGDYHRAYATDQMGFSTSFDGVEWAQPRVILHVTNNTKGQGEGSTCDPSVVFFQGYYYLFYSGNLPGLETVVFLARSTSLYGPFKKYCGRTGAGVPRWGEEEPVAIITAINPPVQTGWYGAGEQSVVVHTSPSGAKTLLMWYSDDSRAPSAGRPRRILFRRSANAIDWSAASETNVMATSIDVKFEEATGLLHMYYVAPRELAPGTYVAHRVSNDGIAWGPEEQLCDPYAFPAFAHNIGVSGNPEGHLLAYSLFGYGGPGVENVDDIFTASANDQPWDLYFHVLDDSLTFNRGYFQFPPGSNVGTFFSDGRNWVAFLTAQDYLDHIAENPRKPDANLGVRSHTQVGSFIGPWHSGMPIPP